MQAGRPGQAEETGQLQHQPVTGQCHSLVAGKVVWDNQGAAGVRRRTHRNDAHRELADPAVTQLEAVTDGPAASPAPPGRNHRTPGKGHFDARQPAHGRVDQLAAGRQVREDRQQAFDHRGQPGIFGAVR